MQSVNFQNKFLNILPYATKLVQMGYIREKCPDILQGEPKKVDKFAHLKNLIMGTGEEEAAA